MTAARPRTSTTRSRLAGAVRWLDDYSLWAMNPARTPRPRDERSTARWNGPADQHVVIRELMR